MEWINLFSGWLVGTFHDVWWPSLVAVGIALPIFVAIAVTWEYFSMPRTQRSIARAFRQALPFEDYRSVSTRTDFANFIVSHLLRPLMRVLLQLVSLTAIAETTRALMVDAFGTTGFQLNSISILVAVQTLTIILVLDLTAYIVHLLSHKLPLLWALHRPHHSAETLTILTTYRAHPLELLFLVPRFLIAGAALGAVCFFAGQSLHPAAMTIFVGWSSITEVHDLLQHSRVKVSLGWFNRIFIGPVLHQIHHSAELRHRDKNLGTKLAIWDWMFGTLYLPKPGEQWRFGLNDEEMGKTNPHIRVRDFYFEPFRYMATSFRTRVHARSVTRPQP